MKEPLELSSSRGVQKYLQRYACSEALIASAISSSYEAVLVVPAFRESADFLLQCVDACRDADGPVLCIVIVNCTGADQKSSWQKNAALIQRLQGAACLQVSQSPPAWWGSLSVGELSDQNASAVDVSNSHVSGPDVLVVDRASEEHVLPEGEGVGLARKIGCDIAVSLWARGRLRQPWVYCTDADASLPLGYFQQAPSHGSKVSARLFAFAHAPGAEGPKVDQATALYEVQLRYYVLALASAGSPYCYHSIGSTLIVHAEAYCAVRGFPRRLAGEDFHLLNKLAKLGDIVAQAPLGASGPCDQRTSQAGLVGLRSRTSHRTIHGTGVAVARLLTQCGEVEHTLYNPRIFEQLSVWLCQLTEFSKHRDLGRVQAALETRALSSLPESLGALGVWKAMQGAAAATRSQPALLRRLHEWFDALKTLRLVHLLQSRSLPPVPWREALRCSSWAVGLDFEAEPRDVAIQLAEMEQRLKLVRGVPAHLKRASTM